jgi:hypothetical protein
MICDLALLCGHLSLFSPYPVVTSCSSRFNVHKFSILPTQCIYVFCVVLGTNSDYIRVQHQLMIDFYNQTKCSPQVRTGYLNIR